VSLEAKLYTKKKKKPAIRLTKRLGGLVGGAILYNRKLVVANVLECWLRRQTFNDMAHPVSNISRIGDETDHPFGHAHRAGNERRSATPKHGAKNENQNWYLKHC